MFQEVLFPILECGHLFYLVNFPNYRIWSPKCSKIWKTFSVVFKSFKIFLIFSKYDALTHIVI